MIQSLIDIEVCRDASSTASNGTISPLRDNVVGQPRYCHFSIIAPVGYQVEIFCTVLNFTSVTSFMRLEYITETNVSKPGRNKIYTSINEVLRLESLVDNSDWFECNWPTTRLYRCIPVSRISERCNLWFCFYSCRLWFRNDTNPSISEGFNFTVKPPFSIIDVELRGFIT